MNGSIKRVKALILKEFFQILRDPSSLIIASIFPVFLLFMYGFGVSLDVNKLKVGLVMENTSNPAQSLLHSLKDSRYFSVEVSTDPQTFYKPLASSEIDMIVWIPFFFSDFWEKSIEKQSNQPAPIYVIADGTCPNSASFAQNYMQGVWQNWLAKMNSSSNTSSGSGISLDSRFWFNEDLDSHYFLIPGSIATVITLIGTLLTALMIAREWERGTMEALMTTPVTIAEILLSKLIPYFILGMLALFLCTILGQYVFQIPFRGSYFALTTISFFYLLVSLATGLLISSGSRDQFTACQIAIISAFLPAFMLSGFIFEIASMPFLIRVLTYMIPARYFVSSLQTLFLVGDVWELLIPYSCILLIFALIIFFIIRLKTKKRLD